MTEHPEERDPPVEVRIGSYRNRVRRARPFEGAPFRLEGGGELPGVEVAYETWGRRAADGGNAILLVHALTGDSHAAAHEPGDRPGWFEGMVGPGRAIDPGRHYLVCPNWLGSNYGTTGPTSTDPATGTPYGARFPAVAVGDVARLFRALGAHLGIPVWRAVIGGSVGGLVVLDYATRFPGGLRDAVVMATAFRAGPWVIAFHGIMRRILALGRDSGDEVLRRRALETARMVGMVTYRSRQEFLARYRRVRAELDWQDRGCRFAVESYLRHQGEKLDQRFDPDAYESMTSAADGFDLGETHGSLEAALTRLRCRILAVGIDTDYLFPLEEQREIVERVIAAGGRAELGVINSEYGHDGFLVEFDALQRILAPFLAATEPAA